MTRYSTENALLKALLHPLSQEWGPRRTIEMIYAKHHAGAVQLFEEIHLHGDHVGCTAPELLVRLQSSAYHPSVWFVPLSLDSNHACHSCLVFAPEDFDIEHFRHDLALLYALGEMGKLCNRSDMLHDWQLPAGLLFGDLAWSDAQGWIHSGSKVVVVSNAREKSDVLADLLMGVFQIKAPHLVELKEDYALADYVFREAAEIFLDEIRKHPRKSPSSAPVERANQTHRNLLLQIHDEEGS